MSFLYPTFLFALASLAIPIIIHLFNFRKFKRVYFSNVRFLKEVQQETKNKARIKQWLILLSRLLALTALVFAFAQPVILPPGGIQAVSPEAVTAIFLDNSFSMDAVERGGRLLDKGKNILNELAENENETSKMSLLTNDFEGRHAGLFSPEEFTNQVDEVQSSPIARPISEALTRQFDLIQRNGAGGKIYVVSDFQKAVTDFDNFPSDTSVQVQLVPVYPTKPENIYIDSCWFESPEFRVNEPLQLKVRIKNLSAEDGVDVPLHLSVNGVQKSPVSFTVASGSEAIVEMSFSVLTNGWQDCELMIRDKQIVFDDRFFFSFDVPEKMDVLVIRGNGAENFVDRIFENDAYFTYAVSNENRIDYASFSNQNLIILDGLASISSGLGQELGKFLDAGGSLLVFPGSDMDLAAYNSFLSAQGVSNYAKADTGRVKVDRINTASSFFDDVFETIPYNIDLPLVRKTYHISKEPRKDSETLLQMVNGEKLLSREAGKNGTVYLSSVALQNTWSNFQSHAIFVPVVLKAALLSGNPLPVYYTIGSDDVIKLPNVKANAETLVKMRSKDGTQEFIPEQRSVNGTLQLRLPPEIKADGVFNLFLNADTLARVALNYSRKESNPEYYTLKELKQILQDKGLSNYTLLESEDGDYSRALLASSQGRVLWKYFIILALIFFAAEIFFIRILK